MTQTVFPIKAPILADIAGSQDKFPINRIFCVGRNYHAHAAEMGVSVDKNTQEPFYFLKDASAYVASGSQIPYPPKTENFHYEMEFVVAIGKDGFQVAQSDADSLIYGYACGLDMTRRDLQQKARETGKPWDLGKNFEQSAVLSPIVRVDECGIINDGAIKLRVNDKTVQQADLNLLIWNVREIIAHLSQFYHLQAGDLIYTGTPEGVGAVKSGDKLQGSIAGVGEIALHIA
ncbi:MAG: fumarylacetoacetate hydrolase family protein [Alysiella sp.]|uniref:fumarylacetoacetate hydrolase family protein n=1 Tax=Alysiella sp. TaxID=1872483 RepID=UPI0026DC4A5E|nr:fumarylacetoacetate hydrolase family protein [Alysiella sp.]MDO4434410.1 fumarylacetoacetate hydrolase family protein [Alysiella sp.]